MGLCFSELVAVIRLGLVAPDRLKVKREHADGIHINPATPAWADLHKPIRGISKRLRW
jgi:hypothetical protein